MTPSLNRRLMSSIKRGDIVWVYTDAALINPWRDGWLETECQRRGARYVFQIPDAWPLAHSGVAEACERRMQFADLTVAVTPQLSELMRARYPQAKVETGEESIDTDLIAPPPGVPSANTKREKVVVWNAPPSKIGEIEKLVPMLEAAYKQIPFVFRVITGTQRPSLTLSFPWEWFPYDQQKTTANFAGVDVALAYYGSKPYYECKGNYKVKTFMSMGLPVVTPEIGYNRILIQNGVNGVLVSTPEEWVSAMVSILGDATYAKSLGQKARQAIVSRYSYSAIARQYIEILSRHFPENLSPMARNPF